MRAIIWLLFVVLVSSFGTAAAAEDSPFDQEILRQAFELSKTCSKNCEGRSFGMVRLPIRGKAAFLIGMNGREYCGSGGCTSAVVVVSGSKLLKIKEGQGITESQAVAMVTGAGDTTSVLAGKPSFDCSKAKSASARLICGDADLSRADGLLGAKFRAFADTDQATRSHLIGQQVRWIRARNVRCGVGPDKARVALEQLKTSKPCMLEAINARLAELGTQQGDQPAGAAPSGPATTNSSGQEPLLAALKQTKLFGVWAFGQQGCSEHTIRTEFLVDQGKVVKRLSLKNKELSRSTVLAVVRTPEGDIRVSYRGKFENQEDVVSHATYRFEGDYLRVWDARSDAGRVIIEGGASTNPQRSLTLPMQKCGGTAQSVAGMPSQDGSAQRVAAPEDDFTKYEVKQIRCYAGYPISTDIDLSNNRVDRRLFFDKARTIKMLNHMSNFARRFCEKEVREGRAWGTVSNSSEIQVGYWGGGGLRAWFKAKNKGDEFWIIEQNQFRAQVSAEEAKRVVQERREMEGAAAAKIQAAQFARIQVVKQARAAVRAKFMSEYNVKSLVFASDFAVNPFVYKGAVTAMHTKFRRMLSETEALFYLQESGQNAIGVINMPSTLFANPEAVILAIRVVGTRSFKVGANDLNLPFGEFVGTFRCGSDECAEFYDPK